MRRSSIHGALTVTGILVLGATLSACQSSAPPSSPSPTTAAAESATPTPSPPAEAEELTCESIVAEDTAAGFADAGWTGRAREDGWMVSASTTLEDGIVCNWMEDHGVGTDNFSWFGWAPIDDTAAAELVAELTGNGDFLLDETPDGRYVTLNPDFAPVVDENGYGMTYFFGDGWVIGAGTRAELQLVRVPSWWQPPT